MDTDQLILEDFVVRHSTDAARVIEQFNTEQALAVIEKLPVDLAVMLIKNMERYAVVKCFESMDIDYAAEIIEKIPVQLTGPILRRMTTDIRELILTKVTPQFSMPLKQMLEYSENSVGAIMNPLVPTLPDDISSKDAQQRVKKYNQQILHYIFITRRDNTFAGIVKLEDLITADSKEKLVSIMKTDIPRLDADTVFHKILNHPGWIEYAALPVLDDSGNFLGAIDQGEIRKIENSIKAPDQNKLTSSALGQLYRIGLESLIYSAGQRINEDK